MIKIGPAGTSGLGYEDGLAKCKELNLEALEVEFTHGIHMNNATAKEIGELAKKSNVELSIHCPYFINLASTEKSKVNASKKRILDSCERGNYLNAKYSVFHAGFYQKFSKEGCYSLVKKEIIDMNKVIKKNKWNVVLAPETTGKRSQFGSVDELLRLRKETKCELCIDFSHIKARDNKIDYDELFKKLKNINHLHCHFSGIEYTEKGERRHLITPENEIRELLKYIKKYNKDVTIINESPDPFGDCAKTKKLLKIFN